MNYVTHVCTYKSCEHKPLEMYYLPGPLGNVYSPRSGLFEPSINLSGLYPEASSQTERASLAP